MDKPGYHRTGLNPNFCISTGMSEHLCRDRIGVRGAHAPPEPTPLLVHDADRRRLLRYIQSDIVRHSNLRGASHRTTIARIAALSTARARSAITRGPHKP